jgi:nicotinate-nucleotide pyrophosphorylase
MTDHTELALLRQDMEEMKKDMKELKGEVKELLEAWNTATGILRVMKWLAGIGSAAAVIVGVYKGYK